MTDERHEEMQQHEAELHRMRPRTEPKLVCVQCGNTETFTALGRAIYTAELDSTGNQRDSRNYEDDDTSTFADVTCPRCGRLILKEFDPSASKPLEEPTPVSALPAHEVDAKIKETLERYLDAARNFNVQSHLRAHHASLATPIVPEEVSSIEEWRHYDGLMQDHRYHQKEHDRAYREAKNALMDIEDELKDLLPPVWYVVLDLGIKARYGGRNDGGVRVVSLGDTAATPEDQEVQK